MNNIPWTEDERSKLTKLFQQGLSDAEIANKLGRTLYSIHSQREKLKLSRIKAGLVYNNKAIEWTDEHIAVLREQVNNGVTYLMIAKMIGKTRHAVAQHARKLKITNKIFESRSMLNSLKATVKHNERPKPNIEIAQETKAPCDAVELINLKPSSCAWPYGSKGMWRFCGKNVGNKGTYCPFHAKRAWTQIYKPKGEAA